MLNKTTTLVLLTLLLAVAGCQPPKEVLANRFAERLAGKVTEGIKADLLLAHALEQQEAAKAERQETAPVEPTKASPTIEELEDLTYEQFKQVEEPTLFEPPDTSTPEPAKELSLPGDEGPRPSEDGVLSTGTTPVSAEYDGLRPFPAGYTVVTTSQVGCPPCRAFKANTLSRLDPAIVTYNEYKPEDLALLAAADSNLTSVPFTELMYNGTRVHWFRGEGITAERLREAVDEHQDRVAEQQRASRARLEAYKVDPSPVAGATGQATPVKAAVLFSTTQPKTTYTQPSYSTYTQPSYSTYNMSWSIPNGSRNPPRSELIEHLANHPMHGVSLSTLQAMTTDQLKRLHDTEHSTKSTNSTEGSTWTYSTPTRTYSTPTRTYSTPTYSKPARSRRTKSYCPGGKC